MKLLTFTIAFAVMVPLFGRAIDAELASAHLIRYPDKPTLSHLENRYASQTKNLYHARYVCRRGGGAHKRWACQAAEGWLLREWRETKAALEPKTPWYITKQIAVAELLGRSGDAGGTDPWPNCPDPYDHAGHSWVDTVQCENGGSWLDSPGYYRCGLQFDPMWERKYGRLCP